MQTLYHQLSRAHPVSAVIGLAVAVAYAAFVWAGGAVAWQWHELCGTLVVWPVCPHARPDDVYWWGHTMHVLSYNSYFCVVIFILLVISTLNLAVSCIWQKRVDWQHGFSIVVICLGWGVLFYDCSILARAYELGVITRFR